MKKEVIIDGYDFDLKGTFKLGKETYSVFNTIKDEKVIVDINKDKKVNLINVVEKSKYRVKPKCNVYLKCGGCKLLHIDYNEQLKIKTNYIENLYKEAFGKYSFYKYINIEKTIGGNLPFNYRNKNQMALKKEKNNILCGMYEENSHNIINTMNCYIQDQVINEIQTIIKNLIIEMRFQVYDEDKKTGIIRHILVKRSQKTKEVLVVIVASQKDFPGKNILAKKIIERRSDVKSIILNVNNRKTSAVLGNEEIVLYGPGFIFDEIMQMRFKITSKSFYQINSEQTEKLYELAIKKANLTKNDIVLDAYSGVGTIGLIASKNVKEVISVELVKEAVNLAISNAKYNKVNNIRFYAQDATEFILKIANTNQKIDVVIMDPPRSGSTKEFLNAIKKIKPKTIIYISCNPKTQVDDLKELIFNYNIEFIQGVDMFPQTNHVECVVSLSRK